MLYRTIITQCLYSPRFILSATLCLSWKRSLSTCLVWTRLLSTQLQSPRGGVYNPTICAPPSSHGSGGFGTNLQETSFQGGQASNANLVTENPRLAHSPEANRVSLGVEFPLAGSTLPLLLAHPPPDSAVLKSVENNIPNEPYYPVVKASKKDNWTPPVDKSMNIMKTNDASMRKGQTRFSQ